MGWQTTRDGATGVHAWMESGLSVGEARSAGHWVSPPEGASLTLPPVLGEAIPLDPPRIVLPSKGPVFTVQDASWSLGGTSGGTVAVCDLATGSVSLPEIRIPVSLDNSYRAELCVAGVVLRSNATVCPAAGSTGRSSGLNAFSDSQSYISALTKRIVDDRDAVGLPEALIRDCRRMGRGSPTIGPRAEEGPKDSRVLE